MSISYDSPENIQNVLCAAALYRDLRAIKLIGANVDISSHFRKPLQLAIENDYLKIVKYLAEYPKKNLYKLIYANGFEN